MQRPGRVFLPYDTTSVVLDSVDGAPAFITPNPENMRVTTRYSELASIGRPAVKNLGGGAASIIARVTNDSEAFSFCGELLQYYALKNIEKFQRGGFMVGQIGTTPISSTNPALKVSRLQDRPGRNFLDVIANNRFSKSDMEQFSWKNGHLPLPEDTRLSFVHQTSSPTTGTEKHIVHLEKPRFFTIDLVIEPLGASGKGVIPGGLRLLPEIVARSSTYAYQVTMHATFNKITAGNWQTEEYKEWTNRLFAKLREALRD